MSFARLVPELFCSDIARSLDFYVGLLGFVERFSRPEDRFAYLDRDGAEIMLEQSTGRMFVAGDLEYPFGRGVSFQIEVADVESLYAATKARSHPVILDMEDRWYRQDERSFGNRQ